MTMTCLMSQVCCEYFSLWCLSLEYDGVVFIFMLEDKDLVLIVFWKGYILTVRDYSFIYIFYEDICVTEQHI